MIKQPQQPPHQLSQQLCLHQLQLYLLQQPIHQLQLCLPQLQLYLLQQPPHQLQLQQPQLQLQQPPPQQQQNQAMKWQQLPV